MLSKFIHQHLLNACSDENRDNHYMLSQTLHPGITDEQLNEYIKVATEKKNIYTIEYLEEFKLNLPNYRKIANELVYSAEEKNVEMLKRIIRTRKIDYILECARVACKNKDFEFLKCLFDSDISDYVRCFAITNLIDEFQNDLEIIEFITKLKQRAYMPYSLIIGKDNFEAWKLVIDMEKIDLNFTYIEYVHRNCKPTSFFGSFVLGGLLLDANYDFETDTFIEIDEEEKKIRLEKLKYIYEAKKNIRIPWSNHINCINVLFSKHLNVDRLKTINENQFDEIGRFFYCDFLERNEKYIKGMEGNELDFFGLLKLLGKKVVYLE